MSPQTKTQFREQKAESRKAILSAALELFAKKGFSATRAEDIAKKANVSKGLIFVHFHTKEDILKTIFDEELERYLQDFALPKKGHATRENFVMLVNRWFEAIKNEPLFVRLSLQLNLDDEYRKFIQRKGKRYLEIYFKPLRGFLKELGSKTPELDLFLLSFIFDGITANYTVAPKLFPIDDIKNHVIKIFLSKWEHER
jgi:AcrR family transcriptional regulator